METRAHGAAALPYASPAPPGTDGGAGPARHDGTGVVRLIGLYKLLKAALMIAVGVTVLHWVHKDMVLIVERWVHRLHLDPENRVMVHHVIPRLTHLNDTGKRLLGCGALAYAVLYTIQGMGLLAARRWAEWLTVVSGVGLVPLEVYELLRHPTWVKGAILISNLAIAVYLYHHVRHRTAAASVAVPAPHVP